MSSSNCPYTKLKNKLSFFSSNKETTNESTEMTTLDTERGIPQVCPFSKDKASVTQNTNKPPTNENKETDEASDEEEVQGGCPVMNSNKKEPENRHFERFYEIPKYGNFDFLFKLKGLLNNEEYSAKTKQLQAAPRHLKYTLFYQNNEKLKKVHEKEFPMVFFVYDEIKEKGNKYYRKKQYKDAIDSYTYAYGILKWIEFKDQKRAQDFLKVPSLDPILDDDLNFKSARIDDPTIEKDSYEACLVYLLRNLSYAYIQLRHYSEAIDCLNEALEIASDRVPDLYFRRSQARTLNKFSTAEDLNLALEDINKALNIKDDQIYREQREYVITVQTEQINHQKEKIQENQSKQLTLTIRKTSTLTT